MPAVDTYYPKVADISNECYSGGQEVTPHDTNELDKVSAALHISVGGTLRVTMVDGTVLNFAAVGVGVIRLRVKKVHLTGTSATGIVALW